MCKDGIKTDVMYSMDWLHLAQDRNRWSVLMKMTINFRFHKNVWKLLRVQRRAVHEGFKSMVSISKYKILPNPGSD
jgi:hypothetical protein